MYSVPHLVFITALIVLANSVGLFGNFNVIIATIRDTSLRTKAGYLMSILCFLQIVCLVSELGNLRVYWNRVAVDQAVCFRMIAVYLFSFIAQSVMYFMLSLDMLIAVVAPLKHKMWPTKPYVFVMCLPPALVAASAFAASYFRESNPKVTCRPPTAVVHHVVVAYTIVVMIINTAAVAMILSLAYLVNKKGKKLESVRHKGSRTEDSDTVSVSSRNRMIRVLSIVVVVFVCTSYLTVVSVHIALQMGLEEDYHDYIMTFNMVLALLTYVQNYYVLWFRSPRYRRAFFQQLSYLRHCSCFRGRAAEIPARPSNSRLENGKKDSTTSF
uniref:G_PROTEIN_RECEP_F1_2 domain-containing protein n=1 Tax=Haemonchus contortus TaxID=6289 RepID=A0A7I5ED14_HAECO